MRHWGFTDAAVTASGPDGGIDVEASGAVAQVKFQAHVVGAPAVQQLYGARGLRTDRQLLFFTGTSYSTQAAAYAEHVGMALFTYDLTGKPTPVNGAAERIIEAHARRSRPTPDPRHHAPQSPSDLGGPGRNLDAAVELAEVSPAMAGGGALLIWFLPATLLLVGLTAGLARGEFTGAMVLCSVGGAAAYAGAVAAARQSVRRATSAAARFVRVVVLIAPATAMWITLGAAFASDADHPSGPWTWVVVSAMALAGPLFVASRPPATAS